MSYNSNFDVDAILGILGTVNEQYGEQTPEDEALRIAAVALLYIRDTHKLDEYRDYFRRFYAPATETVKVSHTFTTREDAEQWLARGGAAHGELVRIAGEGFQVVLLPGGPKFLRLPLPDELGSPKAK
jgi:hypothetical protein